MKFLVDVQLPRKMAEWLTASEHNAFHTIDLPDGNRTTDARIIEIAEQEQRIVVTKDSDFVGSHILRGKPSKLLLISTGNIPNRELEILVAQLILDIVREFQSCSFLELNRTGLIIRSGSDQP